MSVLRGMIATWPGRVLALVIVGVLVGGAAMVSGATAAPAKVEYRTAEVGRATITQTVTVSGSVNPAAQVRLTFRSSGRIAEIYTSVGQAVTTGQALAKIETTDLETALANAQTNLTNAQASYQKQLLAVIDAQKSLEETQRSTANDIANAQQALNKVKTTYAAAKGNLNSLASALRNDVSGLQGAIDTVKTNLGVLLGQLAVANQTSDVRSATSSLTQAQVSINNASAYSTALLTAAITEYSNAVYFLQQTGAAFDGTIASGGDTSGISQQFQSQQLTYTLTATKLSGAIDAVTAPLSSVQTNATSAQTAVNTTTSLGDLNLDPVRDGLRALQVTLTTQLQSAAVTKSRVSQAGPAVSTMNDAIGGSYASAIQSLAAANDRAAQSIRSAQSTVAGKPYDLQTSLASVQTQQAAVDTAKSNLDNATLRATVGGVVQTINGQVGEPASQNTNQPVVALANTASIQLHGTIGEADISKLKLGQVANVTVDALSGARMTGKITGLDAVATIQQGVPVYGVDVTLDIPSPGVKPGMSGSAQVILASKTNVLTVPNLAIRTASGRRVVQVLKDGQPVDTEATFGLANDTLTEVTGGLTEGQLVVLPQPRAGATNRPQGGGGVPGIPFR